RERQFNPFLRLDEPDVRTAASCHSKSPADTPEATFAALRRWKDGWIPPASS
ncbi:hydroxyacylglutathione hydrolase C-terminal domain-containing protein, partial [Acinetobacter baumannii]